MKVEIIKKAGFDYIKVFMNKDEHFFAEPGSFFYSKGDIEIKTKTFGGILGGLKKVFFAKESMFINEIIAKDDNVEVALSSSFPGEIAFIELNNQEWLIKDGSYLMHVGDLDIDTKFMGIKGPFFHGYGLFWLRAKGVGNLFLNTYGNVEIIELNNDSIILDNLHVLAFESTLETKIRKIGSLKSFIFGGEGLVIEFSGSGKIIAQTRNFRGFAEKIASYLPR